MYTNKLTPQITEHTINYNQSDNVSVLTNPTFVVGTNVQQFQQAKQSLNLNELARKDVRPQVGQWAGASDKV